MHYWPMNPPKLAFHANGRLASCTGTAAQIAEILAELRNHAHAELNDRPESADVPESIKQDSLIELVAKYAQQFLKIVDRHRAANPPIEFQSGGITVKPEPVKIGDVPEVLKQPSAYRVANTRIDYLREQVAALTNAERAELEAYRAAFPQCFPKPIATSLVNAEDVPKGWYMVCDKISNGLVGPRISFWDGNNKWHPEKGALIGYWNYIKSFIPTDTDNA